MRKIIPIMAIFFLFSGMVFAQSSSISDITAPIDKIYDLIKAVVSILGIIAITAAGAWYMFSGNNIQARENAKSMVSYSIVGLVLVWVAPAIVGYLTAP